MLQSLLARPGVIFPASIALTLAVLAAAFPSDWRQKDPIEFDVSSPESGTYVLTGQSQVVSIDSEDISDMDERYDDCLGEWFEGADNVTTGITTTDYHVKWVADAGKFDTVWGLLEEAYGCTLTWIAPGDLANTTQECTLTITVDDFNRGDDTAGYDDDPVTKEFTLNAWRLDITAKTSDVTTSALYNDCRGLYEYKWPNASYPFGVGDGVDNVLGFVRPGSPTGNFAFSGKIELNASVPSQVGETAATKYDYFWYQQAWGYIRARKVTDGEWVYDKDWTGDFWKSDNPPEWHERPIRYRDADPMSPSEPQWGDTLIHPIDPPYPPPTQTYRGEMYLYDAPGVILADGSTDTYNRIEADDGTNDYCRFRGFVFVNDITASNIYEWHMGFTLVPSGGDWEVSGDVIFP